MGCDWWDECGGVGRDVCVCVRGEGAVDWEHDGVR